MFIQKIFCDDRANKLIDDMVTCYSLVSILSLSRNCFQFFFFFLSFFCGRGGKVVKEQGVYCNGRFSVRDWR